MLTIKDLDFFYSEKKWFKKPKKRILFENTNVQLNSGEIFGLIGPNGSGKTTFAKILMGVLSPQSGSLCYQGKPYVDCPSRELKEQIGVMSGALTKLFVSLSLEEQVELYQNIYSGFVRLDIKDDRFHHFFKEVGELHAYLPKNISLIAKNEILSAGSKIKQNHFLFTIKEDL